MKRIIIDIYGKEDEKLNGLISINSNDLCINYANTLTMHGLQCSHQGGTVDYLQMQNILEEITDLIRELNIIYK